MQSDQKKSSAPNRATAFEGQPPAARSAGVKRLGDLLLEKGAVTERDVANAAAMQREVGGLFGQALLRLGAVTEETLLEVLSEQLSLQIVDEVALPLEQIATFDTAAELGLPSSWLHDHRAAVWAEYGPGAENGRKLIVVAAHPLDTALREAIDSACFARENDPELRFQSVEYRLASNQTVEIAMARQQRLAAETSDDEDFADATRLREMAEEAPVIDFVNNVFALALKENASDIHLEAFEHSFRVRYRVDGVLVTRQSQSRSRFDAVSSRIKLLAGMDIAERRLPQDGRHTIRFAGNEIDLRVSSVPSSWGESLVIRLLRKKSELPDMEGLGLSGATRDALEDLLKNPNGIILVTGPTGSGKSTTLYRSLERLNDGVRKIITIEDPVEYDVAGVTQIQVKPDIGYNFASGLRAILRQDPDIIMVGEIRDGETAKIAAQAALTGHLVLSTLHTNSSLAAVTRLTDIGLEPFLIGDSVRGLIAQRLVRRLCAKCARRELNDDGEALLRQRFESGARIGPALQQAPAWRRAIGCDACDGTGYDGRVAIFEIVKVNDPMREAIIRRAPLSELFAIAREQGFTTLFEDALIKARSGITSYVEAVRVCGGDIDIPKQ